MTNIDDINEHVMLRQQFEYEQSFLWSKPPVKEPKPVIDQDYNLQKTKSTTLSAKRDQQVEVVKINASIQQESSIERVVTFINENTNEGLSNTLNSKSRNSIFRNRTVANINTSPRKVSKKFKLNVCRADKSSNLSSLSSSDEQLKEDDRSYSSLSSMSYQSNGSLCQSPFKNPSSPYQGAVTHASQVLMPLNRGLSQSLF